MGLVRYARLCWLTVVLLAATLSAQDLRAQDPPAAPPSPTPAAAESARPLPEVLALMRAVESSQRAQEAAAKDYLYRASTRAEEFDRRERAKKVETREYEVFWIDGVNVRRLIRRDGKELTPDEAKKENERIDRQAAKARERRDKADAKGEETDAEGHEEVPLARILELGAFSNERRVTLDGRDAIAVDFTGDPKAKTRNRTEGLLRDAAGTVWVDEQDKSLVRLEAHMVKDFRIGGGLIADLRQGSSVTVLRRKVNGEAWLPVSFEGHGKVRVLLFGGFNGNVQVKFGDYRKFKATSTIVPIASPGQEDNPKTAPAPNKP